MQTIIKTVTRPAGVGRLLIEVDFGDRTTYLEIDADHFYRALATALGAPSAKHIRTDRAGEPPPSNCPAEAPARAVSLDHLAA